MNLKQTIGALIVAPSALLVLLCGCQKQEPKPVIAPSGGTSIVSAEKTSFAEVTSKLNKGGNLYLYLSTEQVLGGLSGKLASASNFLGSFSKVTDKQRENIGTGMDFFRIWLKDSGIEEIGGLGVSSIAREPGFYYGKLVVYHEPGQDEGLIWSLFGASAHPLDELDMLPENAALAFSSDLDVPLAWKSVEKELRQLDLPGVSDALEQWPDQFKKMTGLDFDKTLASLGGNYGLILTLDPDNQVSVPFGSGTMEMPSPGLAIVVKVKSDLIFDRIDALNKKNPLIMRVNRPDLKMRTMAIPLPLPVELRPSVARSGDYLFLASSDTLVKDIVDVKAGRKKGFKATPEFARLSQGIPAEGNNFALVTAQFMKSISQIQSEVMTNQGSLNPSQVAALQRAFNGTNGGNYSVGANGSEGWEGFANGSQSVQSMLVPLAAGISVMAAMAIPSLVKAHSFSQQKNPAAASHNVKYSHLPGPSATPARKPAEL